MGLRALQSCGPWRCSVRRILLERLVDYLQHPSSPSPNHQHQHGTLHQQLARGSSMRDFVEYVEGTVLPGEESMERNDDDEQDDSSDDPSKMDLQRYLHEFASREQQLVL